MVRYLAGAGLGWWIGCIVPGRADNLALLRDHRLSSALDHDLRVDLRRAGQLIMHTLVALPVAGLEWPSPVAVVTPVNLQN